MRLETIYEDETSRQAYFGTVHLAAWFDAPTYEQMRAYGRHARELSGRYPKTGLMNLIVRGRPNFDPAVRAEVRRLTERGVHAAGSAHVVLAAGLVGAAARAFMSTTVLLGRPKNPTRVFGDLDAAALWMGEQLDLDPAPLVDACGSLVSGSR